MLLIVLCVICFLILGLGFIFAYWLFVLIEVFVLMLMLLRICLGFIAWEFVVFTLVWVDFGLFWFSVFVFFIVFCELLVSVSWFGFCFD